MIFNLMSRGERLRVVSALRVTFFYLYLVSFFRKKKNLLFSTSGKPYDDFSGSLVFNLKVTD